MHMNSHTAKNSPSVAPFLRPCSSTHSLSLTLSLSRALSLMASSRDAVSVTDWRKLCFPLRILLKKTHEFTRVKRRESPLFRLKGLNKGNLSMNSMSSCGFLNMATTGDFDPLNATIPATKVEITVSCRWGTFTYSSHLYAQLPFIDNPPDVLINNLETTQYYAWHFGTKPVYNLVYLQNVLRMCVNVV